MAHLWTFCGVVAQKLLALSLVESRKDSRRYSSQHLTPPADMRSQIDDYDQIIDALKVNQKPTHIDKHRFNKENMKKIAQEVNASNLHFSGNCVLLSTVLMYNLLNNHGCFLAAKNTYPIIEGVSPDDASNILLGQKLWQFHPDCKSIDETENIILERYKTTGETVFSVSVQGYSLPIVGETGHQFNALVYLDEHNEPRVQFVDAWKTSNVLPSTDDIKSAYPVSATFSVTYCPNKALLKNFSSMTAQNNTTTSFKEQLMQIKGSVTTTDAAITVVDDNIVPPSISSS